eukprot:tig00000215_g18568.t1
MARTKRKAANLENLPTDPRYSATVANLRAVAEFLEMNSRLIAGVKAIQAKEQMTQADIEKCARDLVHVNMNCSRVVAIYNRLVSNGAQPPGPPVPVSTPIPVASLPRPAPPAPGIATGPAGAVPFAAAPVTH